MLEHSVSGDQLQPALAAYGQEVNVVKQAGTPAASYALAASITKEASEQTYYTIRLLADRRLMADAFRAYAYFRWVDDMLDQVLMEKPERLSFIERQKRIIAHCYKGEWAGGLSAEEQMVADLIRGDQEEDSGLRSYIENMMRVMAFDVDRKGSVISEEALGNYTHWLATAVTEALHHFIGNGSAVPQGESRYLAVTGAHITHMLRDSIDDTATGYYNIPQAFLESHGVSPTDVAGEPVRSWVRSQVQLARRLFEAGKVHIAQVENIRCRIAGFAYVARFEVVLDAIERDGYRLRPDYPERKSLAAGLKMAWSALSQTFVSALDTTSSSCPTIVTSEGFAR